MQKRLLLFTFGILISLTSYSQVVPNGTFEDWTDSLLREFYSKYYSDSSERIFIIGINPGRLGGGTTGISFTDPVSLEEHCGIKNTFRKNKELSSTFVYRIIDEYGGTIKFFGKFFLTAVCPLGFVKEGKNINYYDDRNLVESTRDFISRTFVEQLSLGANRNVAICLGEGKNLSYLSKLNEEIKAFKRIVPLPHPRFIMQYRRKSILSYTERYIRTLNDVQK